MNGLFYGVEADLNSHRELCATNSFSELPDGSTFRQRFIAMQVIDAITEVTIDPLDALAAEHYKIA